MAKQDNRKYVPDLLPPGTIVEVIRRDAEGNVVMKEMTHGDFKKMEKQKGFRYQEFQKGFSQFNVKKL